MGLAVLLRRFCVPASLRIANGPLHEAPLALVLMGAGFLNFMDGFSYDLVFGGIPCQDPMPEVTVRHTHLANVALLACHMVAGVVFLGILAGITRLVIRRFRRCTVS